MMKWSKPETIGFCKTKDAWGGFSNMCAGFPLNVNGIRIRTSEALYQACRFPYHSSVQEKIINERSPMSAKAQAKANVELTRDDWNGVRLEVMLWCLRVKLCQNWDKFSDLLLETGDRDIVEISNKDSFWGAKRSGGSFVGNNNLGQLISGLRDVLKDDPDFLMSVPPPSVKDFLFFDEPIRGIRFGR